MKLLLTIALMVMIAPAGYCQQPTDLTKEDVLKAAKEYTQSAQQPTKAVYVPEEGAWIVLFEDQSPTPAPDSDFMVRIDAVSGKPLGVIGGALKQEYYKYFKVTQEEKGES